MFTMTAHRSGPITILSTFVNPLTLKSVIVLVIKSLLIRSKSYVKLENNITFVTLITYFFLFPWVHRIPSVTLIIKAKQIDHYSHCSGKTFPNTSYTPAVYTDCLY